MTTINEKLYSVDDMILLAAEMATNELIGYQTGGELLYQKVWAHVKSTLPIECKEDYVKSMVRSAIIMYLGSIATKFRPVIFSDEGYGKINVDVTIPNPVESIDIPIGIDKAEGEALGKMADLISFDEPISLGVSSRGCGKKTEEEVRRLKEILGKHFEEKNYIANYDRAMKFVV